MTESIMAQTRRNGVLAAHSVDEYVISVPDLEEARTFYTTFGLNVVDEGEGLALYAFNNPHRYARLVKGERKRLLWIAFGIYADDMEAFTQHVEKLGVERVQSPDPMHPDGLWVRSSDGFPVHIKPAPKTSPSDLPPREFTPASNGTQRAPSSSAAPTVQPLYMSHLLIFTKNVSNSLKFYGDLLGLRVSDSSGPTEEEKIIAFLHSPHGSDHHMLAFLQSEDYGFHHSSWTVQSIDHVGLGMRQMSQAGYDFGWGVGRHVLGSNYFRYTRDPWGSFIEYSFDIDFVPHTMDWQARHHPPEDSLYVWGPDVPEPFSMNSELAKA
jgi:catechol 2,3-dioxygenase-like lactoylglutathione lyase family enzyme